MKNSKIFQVKNVLHQERRLQKKRRIGGQRDEVQVWCKPIKLAFSKTAPHCLAKNYLQSTNLKKMDVNVATKMKTFPY